MDLDFAPIRIVECDETKVRKASGSKARYVVPFTLSARPPRDWEDLFDDAWTAERKRSQNAKAQAYVRKGALVLECTLADIKTNFPSIRSSIDSANEKFSTQLQQKAEKDEKKRRKRDEEKQAEKQAIHEALDGLNLL